MPDAAINNLINWLLEFSDKEIGNCSKTKRQWIPSGIHYHGIVAYAMFYYVFR
jgi:hypothetical protein